GGAGGRGGERLHRGDARPRGRDAARVRPPGARAVRDVLRAAVAGPAHRQPVRAVLADVQPDGVAGRLADGAPGPRPPRGDPARTEVGGARQARPGERHGARAVPGTGRAEPLAAAPVSGGGGMTTTWDRWDPYDGWDAWDPGGAAPQRPSS